MSYTAPRFNPIPGGTGVDRPTDYDRSSERDDSGNRSITHRNSGVVAYATRHIYRAGAILVSGITFLSGTGFAIYNAVTGR